MKLLSAIIVSASAAFGLSCERAPDLGPYEGLYAKGSLDFLTVSLEERGLTARPLFWRSVQSLYRSGADTFYVVDRRDRTLIFTRSTDGSISGVNAAGLGPDGFYRRVADEEKPAIMGLFGGDAAWTAKELIADTSVRSEELLRVARQFLGLWPSKAMSAEKFTAELARAFPRDDRILSTWADAHVALGQRSRGKELYEQAIAINPANAEAALALVRLGVRRPQRKKDALEICFSLEELFEPATDREISLIREEWGRRDLTPVDWQEVERLEMMIAGLESNVRIMAHRVQGDLHYGAIVAPHGAGSGPRPVMIEARGVSWDYKAFDLERNFRLPVILGDRGKDFVYVIPSFRGERMTVQGREYRSEGDRTDAWDGATDDALALLELALKTTPEADSARIGIFGQSRGGSVALLAAIRDKRIRTVVSWCGPVDWFTHMGSGGWSLQEIVREGLLLNAVPPEPGGQFIERYLRRSNPEEQTLRFARHRMIASSPLYFLEHLPRVRCSYGREDMMVPVVNAESLIKAFRGSDERECRIVEGAGHDLEWAEASAAREFLVRTLLSPDGR